MFSGLEGLRVLDFSRLLAGPYATRMLADLGAEVIKVQSRKTAAGVESNDSAYFRNWNRNKRSITLDLSQPEARDVVLKLTALCDVVVENFSPRVMLNWQLGYQHLIKARADLIMLRMSAMGNTGPWRDFVGFGPTIQALSGMTFLSSYDEKMPVGLGFSYADVISGLYGVLAILAALEHRERTGLGQCIDLSEYEAMCTLLGPTFMDVTANGRDVLPWGNSSGHIPAAPYGCYRCQGEDRWCVIAVFNESQWNDLCHAIGNPPWTQDGRFLTLASRKLYAQELDALIQEQTSKLKAEELVELLQQAGIPAGVVQNAQDIAHDPQFIERGFFVEVKDPVYGMTVSDGLPFRFAESQADRWNASPRLGEDNSYVFGELLKFRDEELSAYLEKGVIR